MNEPRDDIEASLEPGAWLDRDFLRRVGEETRACFPRQLADAELVLIDVDPNHLHAFWNIPLPALDAARSRAGEADAPLILRLFAVDDPPAFTDTEVGGLQGRTYVGVYKHPRRYRASIGLRAGNGSIAELARSNEVELPPVGPAPETAGGVHGAGGPVEPFKPLFDLEAVMPLSSYVLAGDRVAFEAVAELHIHGRAEPGSTVRMFGRNVPLRPDGSFSLIRVLPNDEGLLSALLAGEPGKATETDGPA